MRKLLLLALVAASLGACAPSVPKEAQIEIMLRESLLGDGMGDLFRLENFVKTNGFRESENVYVVDVEYELVFEKSFADVVREISADPTGPQYGLFGAKFILTAIQANFGQFEAGDRISKTDKLRLHNTEQGWQLAGR